MTPYDCIVMNLLSVYLYLFLLLGEGWACAYECVLPVEARIPLELVIDSCETHDMGTGIELGSSGRTIYAASH